MFFVIQAQSQKQENILYDILDEYSIEGRL